MPKRRTDRVTITDAKRRAIAEEMLRLQYLDHRPLAECWKLTHPEFDGKARSAEVMARGEITWYFDSFPEAAKYLRQLLIMRTDDILAYLSKKNEDRKSA